MHIYRWLLSGLIALAIACVLYSGVSLADESFRLHLSASGDSRLLAFLAFPLLLPVTHWWLHKRIPARAALLIAGLVLSMAGGLVYFLGREADARHVSMGPFSGLEYSIQMAAGILFVFVGGLLILVWSAATRLRKTEA